MQTVRKTTRAYSLVLLLSGLLFSSFLMGATVETNGTGGGDWSSAGTWLNGQLPTATDVVVIKSGDDLTVSASVTCATLQMVAGTSTDKTNLIVNPGQELTVTTLLHIYSPDPNSFALINNNGTITAQNVRVEDQDMAAGEAMNGPMDLTVNGTGLLDAGLFFNFCNKALTVTSNSNIKTTLLYMRGGTAQTDLEMHNKNHLDIRAGIYFWGPLLPENQVLKNSGTLVRGHSDVVHYWNGGTVDNQPGSDFVAQGGAWINSNKHTYANMVIDASVITSPDDITCNDLTINAGKKLVATGAKVNVSGAFTCEGELELTSINDLVFNGGFTQVVPQLTIVNNASGTVSIVGTAMPQPQSGAAAAAGKVASMQNFRRINHQEKQWIKTYNPYYPNLVPAGLGGVHLDGNTYNTFYASPNYLVEVKVDSYNNGAAQEYKTIDLKNRIRVSIDRDEAKLAGAPNFNGTVVLELDQRNNPSIAVPSVIELPFSYSNDAATVENDASYYYFETGYSFLAVKKIVIKDKDGKDIASYNDLEKCITVELTVEEERYEIDQHFGTAEVLTLSQKSCSGSSGPKDLSHLVAEWTRDGSPANYPNPVRFELEWVFIDGRITGAGSITNTDDLYTDNASRVMTYSKSYQIPNTFAHNGTVYARYRMVRPGITLNGSTGKYELDDYFMRYGEWVYSSFAIDANTRFNETEKNFTIESTYAEDDLRKDVITFFDGSGKSRSVMTNLSEGSNIGEEIAIIAQSMYDYEGNAVVQPLPVPVKRTCATEQHVFVYKNHANQLSGTATSEKDKYDAIGGTTVPTLTNGSIAEQYYSTSSPNTVHKNFLPQSDGYAYSYTELSGYGSAKPVSQSAPGAPYKFGGTGKTTRFEYAEPAGVELDILFGNNVSENGFYKKTIVTDPNNQSTVTYTDGHGRTIATALLSNTSSDPLLEIDEKPAPKRLTEDLFRTGRISVLENGRVLELTKTIYIDRNSTQVDVDYTITPKNVTDNCLTNWCYQCKYHLEAYLLDEKTGDKFDLRTSSSTLVQPFFTSASCTNNPPIPFTHSQGLNKQSYTLVKRLTLLNDNDAAMQTVLDDYINLKKQNNCLRDLYSFQEEEMAQADFDQCEQEKVLTKCSSYEASLKKDMVPVHGAYGKRNPAANDFSLFQSVTTTLTTNNTLDAFETAPGAGITRSGCMSVTAIPNPPGGPGINLGNYFEASGSNVCTHGTVIWEDANTYTPTGSEKFTFQFEIQKRMFYDFTGGNNINLELITGSGAGTVAATISLNRVGPTKWKTYSIPVGNNPLVNPRLRVVATVPAQGFEIDFAIDNIRLTGTTSCDCNDWGIPANANGYYAGATHKITHPYQCLKAAFDDANIQVKKPSNSWWKPTSPFFSHKGFWVNPAELDKEDFIDLYQEEWLDEMVKMHPLYCNLVQCELINTPKGELFKRRLEDAHTLTDLEALNFGAPKAMEIGDPITILDADPLFVAVSATNHNYHWLYASMLNKITTYYSYTPSTCGGTPVVLSMKQMALIMALGYSINNIPCPAELTTLLNTYMTELSKPTIPGLYKNSGLADKYWGKLKGLYLNYRSFLVNGIYDEAPNCHTCLSMNANILANNPFPKYSTKPCPTCTTTTTKPFDVVKDQLTNAGWNGTALTLPATQSNVNMNKAIAGGLLTNNKSTDCTAHLEYQIRRNFTITVGTPIPPQTQNDVDLVHLKNNTTVTVAQMITDLSGICNNPDEDEYNIGGATTTNNNNVTHAFTRLYGGVNRYYSTSDPDAIQFEYNPYHIQPLSKLHNNRHLPVEVKSGDVVVSGAGTGIQGLVAAYGAATNSTSQCMAWANLSTFLNNPTSYHLMSKVETDNSVTPPALTSITTALSGHPCSGPINLEMVPLTEMMEYGLLSGSRNYGMYFFRISFDIGTNHYDYTYMSDSPVYEWVNPGQLTFNENPAHHERINANSLATYLTDFIQQVIGKEAFTNTTVTAGGTGIPSALWEKHYRVLLRNYFNHRSGLDLSYEHYRDAMMTADVFDMVDYSNFINSTNANGCSTCLTRATSESILQERFDFYGKPPIVCEDEADVSCTCYTNYVTQFRNYVRNQTADVDFMEATAIQNYFTSNIMGYTGQVQYAEEDYVDEMNHLYVVNQDVNDAAAVTDLNKLFGILFQQTYEAAQYPDDINNTPNFPSKLTIQSTDLFPTVIGQPLTNGINCWNYNLLSKGEFLFTSNGGCNLANAQMSMPNDVLLRTRMCSDGTYWVHANSTGGKTYKDVYLNYELFNWSYVLNDIDPGVAPEVTPIVKGEGDVYDFTLTVTLKDGRVVKIPGRSTERIATICRIPNAILWDNGKGFRPVPRENCEQELYSEAMTEAQRRYDEYIKKQRGAFYDKIVQTCAQTEETMTYSFSSDLYNYTLYYYDQAGNLIQTVPPEGVFWKSFFMPTKNANGEWVQDDTKIGAIRTYRDWVKGGRVGPQPPFQNPGHTLTTSYEYNTLNQITQQKTPDGGLTKFWYDALGRIALSQNAEQASRSVYSYSLYDNLSRIYETGEVVDLPALNKYDESQQFIQNYAALKTDIEDLSRNHVVKTFYEQKLGGHTDITNVQENLMNRVSTMCFYETRTKGTKDEDYENAVYYSYDISGNVKTLWRNILDIGLDVVKQVDYDYDLISGNVRRVRYQDGKEDMLVHRYTYDSDNRITKVELSRDGANWEKGATYEYYLHGPLARTTMGKNHVQGMDYAYTLQGWIKQVNGIIDMTSDDDGTSGNQTHDALAYVLHYNGSDYNPVGGSSVAIQASSGSMTGLYNGNIPGMEVKYRRNGTTDIYTKTYRYDQLNRIKHYLEPDLLNVTNTSALAGVNTNAVGEYKYDGNGNITALNRGNVYRTPAATRTMIGGENELGYQYTRDGNNMLVSNRLHKVIDAVPENILLPNANPTVHEYDYDAIGNLTKDHFNQTATSWNPIGKVDAVTTRVPFNTSIDGVRPGMDMDIQYDPMGHRIAKSVMDYDQSGTRYCDSYNVEYAFGGEEKFRDIVLCEFDDQSITINGIETILKERILALEGGGLVLGDFTSFFVHHVSRVPYVGFKKVKNHKEYYIKDAQGNVLATYQRELTLEKTVTVIERMLDNIKDYSAALFTGGYTWNQVILEYATQDLALRESFIDNTYDLLGYGDDPPLNFELLILENDDRVYRLNANYGSIYAMQFLTDPNTTDVFRNLVKHTDAFHDHVIPVLEQEVIQNGYSLGGSTPQEEAFLIYNNMLTSNTPPDLHYFIDGTTSAPFAYVEAALMDIVVYTSTPYKTMLLNYLQADPTHMAQLYNLETKKELYISQFANTPALYIEELKATSQYAGQEAKMVAEWMSVTENYDLGDLLKRARAVMQKEATLDQELLGLKPLTVTLPGGATKLQHSFHYAYAMDLTAHYLYGSSRLGTMKGDAYTHTGSVGKHTAGETQYELNDHLGNVRTVISDRRIAKTSGGDEADVVEQSDYYPFGMVMEERHFTANIETRKYEDFQNLRAELKVDNTVAPRIDNFDPVTFDWLQWCFTLYKDNNYSGTDLPGNAAYTWGGGYIYAHGNIGAYGDKPGLMEKEVFNGVNVLKLTAGGNANLKAFNVHSDVIPYSGTTAIDTLEITFDIWMDPTVQIDEVATYAHNTSGIRTVFDHVPVAHNIRQWVTIKDTVLVNNNNHTFAIRFKYLNNVPTSIIRLKNVQFQRLKIDKFAPMSLTQKEKRDYRFGFNGMEREKEWRKDYNRGQLIWADDFSSGIGNWTPATGSGGQPLAVYDATNKALEFVGAVTNTAVTKSVNIDVEIGEEYVVTVYVTGNAYDINEVLPVENGSFPLYPRNHHYVNDNMIKMVFKAKVSQFQIGLDNYGYLGSGLRVDKVEVHKLAKRRPRNHDFGARIYDPVIARWFSVDPLADDPIQIGMSPYSAMWNNPVKWNDPDGQCPMCITAAIGGVIGGIVGGAIAASQGGNWKDVVTGAGAGFVGGAIVGSGAGLIGAGSLAAGLGLAASTGTYGVGAAIGITGSLGGLAGGASSLVTQGSEKIQGKRSQISGYEVTTDMLIGVPTALLGGAMGNAATSQIKKVAADQISKSIRKTATKEYKKVIKNTLKSQYPSLGRRQTNKIANQTIKTIQSGVVKEIEAIRVSIQAGVLTGIEAVTQTGTNKVDEKVGDN